MKTFKGTLILSALGLMTLPSLILAGVAQPPEDLTDPTSEVITEPDQIWNLIMSLRNYFWAFLGIVIVVMLGMAAYNFLTASGSEDKVNKGRDMVKYALIGVAIILLTGGIMTLMENVLKLGQ